MRWVADSSIALAFVLPDEHSGAAQRFFASSGQMEALWAPALWHYEIANVLALAMKKGRIDSSQFDAALEVIGAMPWRFHAAGEVCHVRKIAATATRFGLTAYDAAYLDLAIDMQCGLATLDNALKLAAKKARVKVFA